MTRALEMKRAFHDHLGSAALERGKEEKKRGRHTELALRLRRPWGEWYTAAVPFKKKLSQNIAGILNPEIRLTHPLHPKAQPSILDDEKCAC